MSEKSDSSVDRTMSTPNAWLMNLGSKMEMDAFSIRVPGDSSSSHGSEVGDGFIVVDGSTGSVMAFARLYRMRCSLDETTIYFDGLLPVSPNKSIGDFGIQPTTILVSRLEWPIFESALKTICGIDFSALPIINGRTPKEQAYIRDLLQLAVEDDLLGPADGPFEEIVGMSVRDRYLVGKLAPCTDTEVESIEGLQGQTALEDDIEDGKTPENLDPHIGHHSPGDEFASTEGHPDPDDDDSQGVDASKNQSYIPSSFGLTFCIDSTVKTLELDVRWGRYEKTTSKTQTDDDGKTLRAWKRIPAGGNISLSMKEGPIKPIAPDHTCPRVLIQGTIRPSLASGDRLVTVFLVNDQLQPEKNQDEAWLFQPEMILRHADGKAVFRRRPVFGTEDHDPERGSLEMIYRKRVEFAVGHSVSVHAKPSVKDDERAVEVRTVVLPQYEVAITETPGTNPEDRPAMRRLVEEGSLDMMELSKFDRPSLLEKLSILVDDYERWIDEQRKRCGRDVMGHDSSAALALDRCGEILSRLREGMVTLAKNDDALEVFSFMNRSMAMQRIRSIYSLKRRRGEKIDLADVDLRENRSWRPFQLAFILLSISSLADPTHPDRTKPFDAYADLLWFPTGGGKTEAYLGVAAFAMAIRRRQGDLGGLDNSRGLSVIMRYTLRLLTLQQFQRATTLICAMEEIRRSEEDKWGENPFTIGLWVGQKVTPNTTEQSHETILEERSGKNVTRSTPAQLKYCPWCGEEIVPGHDIEVKRFDSDTGKTVIYCGDKLNACEFGRVKSKDFGLPVVVVDEEIYRRPPSLLIGTVDKFAMMAWRGQVKTLFGRVSKECERHGLLWSGSECTGSHQKKGTLKSTKTKDIKPLRPPDLVIQDEFHLISGPLGTIVGLYETAVDELATWRLEDNLIRPKVIASTATVRKAAEQINNVFLRRVSIFPPHGLDVEDNFFSVQRSIEDRPGRRYMGICSPGSARPAVLIRVYTALLTAAQTLFARFGSVADPYMTLVGYFNSLRELGGMKRLAEDDVQTRSFRVQMSRVTRPGLSQRNVRNVDELTSRVASRDIPDKLDQLEINFKGLIDPSTGLHKVNWNKGEIQAIDVVLATNMLSVGVDVNRLGLMVVNGQPKSTAEYIQATSRVGRSFPGLVCTVLTWSRPRDLSHYETFEHYHATFYKHVEAQSVTPFSPRALDRGLTGTMVSWLRLGQEEYNPNLGAEKLDSSAKPEINGMKSFLSQRAWKVTSDKDIEKLAKDMIGERCDEWVKEATRGGRKLGYEPGKKKKKGEDDIAGLLKKPGIHVWDHFTVPMSMREVEPGVRLVMKSDTLPEGPAWKIFVEDSKKKGGKS